jgi:hypothetical protein
MMPDNNQVWKSEVTRDMVKGWSDDEIELLIADLDDAVKGVLEDFEGAHDE